MLDVFRQELAQLAPGHQARGNFRQRHSGGFGDIGHGSRGARIHFQHVHGVTLDGELNIHQADHVESAGQAMSVVAHSLELAHGNVYCRQHAR